MPKAEHLYEPLSVNAVPVAVPVGTAVPVATPVLASSPVVEGKMMRQVATNRVCQDVMWAVIFLFGLVGALA